MQRLQWKQKKSQRKLELLTLKLFIIINIHHLCIVSSSLLNIICSYTVDPCFSKPQCYQAMVKVFR